EGREHVWKPALVEIEEALVPAFIIRCLTTAAAPSSSRRYPRRSPEPSTFSPPSACIRSTFRSHRRSRPLPVGDRDRRSWSRRWGRLLGPIESIAKLVRTTPPLSR